MKIPTTPSFSTVPNQASSSSEQEINNASQADQFAEAVNANAPDISIAPGGCVEDPFDLQLGGSTQDLLDKLKCWF